MTQRPTVIAGNWKMHFTKRTASRLAREVVAMHNAHPQSECIVFTTFVHLEHVRRNLKNSGVVLGAQNCHEAKTGACTGEISPYMLRDMGAEVVLVGHSERRHDFGESDERLAKKLKTALRAKLDVILCIGETQAERESGDTFVVLARQMAALKGVKAELAPRIRIAYEPVWAIGTGLTATPEIAQEAHAETRRLIAEHFGPDAAATMPILYGGSVKPANVTELLAQPDIDGALVGGASLTIENFGPLLSAAPK